MLYVIDGKHKSMPAFTLEGFSKEGPVEVKDCIFDLPRVTGCDPACLLVITPRTKLFKFS